jgi:hypothetical protein
MHASIRSSTLVVCTAAVHTLMSAPLQWVPCSHCAHCTSTCAVPAQEMGKVQLSWLTEHQESLQHSLCTTAGFDPCWCMSPGSKKPCCTQTSKHEYRLLAAQRTYAAHRKRSGTSRTPVPILRKVQCCPGPCNVKARQRLQYCRLCTVLPCLQYDKGGSNPGKALPPDHRCVSGCNSQWLAQQWAHHQSIKYAKK